MCERQRVAVYPLEAHQDPAREALLDIGPPISERSLRSLHHEYVREIKQQGLWRRAVHHGRAHGHALSLWRPRPESAADDEINIG
jgi:hypothetical protein